MNDDTDESDTDDDYALIHQHPFPDDCQDEIQGIESFSACFMRRYNACPVFYTGSLQNACQEAFGSIEIEDRRPLLLYIHHDDNIFNNIFCSNIFCSEIIIDYLLQNYMVWPWDMTHESNRTKFFEIWGKTISTTCLNNYSVEEYPMLVGIMRQCDRKNRQSCSFEYEFKILLKNDKLNRTQEKVTKETLLRELIVFKEECDEHEKTLSFDFIALTGICMDIVFEISQYLSLNDIVYAFSDKILPLFRQCNKKVHISQPSIPFMNTILPSLDINQIISLRLNRSPAYPQISFSSLTGFPNVVSLTLVNLFEIGQINNYTAYFPKLMCLSLYYESRISFSMFKDISAQLHQSIKRFEIHCPGVFCTHYDLDQLNRTRMLNLNVNYFILEVGPLCLPSMNDCLQRLKSCFLAMLIHFIQIFPHIQYVRILIDQYNLTSVLDWNSWSTIFPTCQQLKKIKLEKWQDITCGERYVQRAAEIQRILLNRQ